MRSIRRWLEREATHQNMSMVSINIISHGTKEGFFKKAGDDGYGLFLPDLVGTLCENKELAGKPKLFFINACRGGNHTNIYF